jgi:hypothetical protein
VEKPGEWRSQTVEVGNRGLFCEEETSWRFESRSSHGRCGEETRSVLLQCHWVPLPLGPLPPETHHQKRGEVRVLQSLVLENSFGEILWVLLFSCLGCSDGLQIEKGRIWTFEQEQALGFSNVATNTRMTVIKLKSGGLWVHAPIAPTGECIQVFLRR